MVGQGPQKEPGPVRVHIQSESPEELVLQCPNPGDDIFYCVPRVLRGDPISLQMQIGYVVERRMTGC